MNMNKKTPKKRNSNGEKTGDNAGFSPVVLTASPAITSPQKNLTGTPRVIKDIIADLYNNIQRWNSLHIKGCALVKQIASLKTDEPRKFSPRIDECLNELYNIVQKLQENNDFFNILISQADALEKLPNVPNPVFFSLDVASISQSIKYICSSYKKEFEAKQLILENIGFSKNTNESMFFAAYWTYQLNITNDTNFKLESLLVETGHRAII